MCFVEVYLQIPASFYGSEALWHVDGLSVMEWFVMGQPEEKDPIWQGFSPLAGNSVSPFPCLTQNQHFSTPVWLFERLPVCPLPTSTFQPFLYSCPLHQKQMFLVYFVVSCFLVQRPAMVDRRKWS